MWLPQNSVATQGRLFFQGGLIRDRVQRPGEEQRSYFEILTERFCGDIL